MVEFEDDRVCFAAIYARVCLKIPGQEGPNSITLSTSMSLRTPLVVGLVPSVMRLSVGSLMRRISIGHETIEACA